MPRFLKFISNTVAARDYFAMCLSVLIVGVAAWAVSILFSPTMKKMAMERFHLGSDHFGLWAVHQSVPAMYNFENRVQFTNELIGEAPFDATNESYLKKTINHFPAQFINFGNYLPTCFSKVRHGTFEMSTIFADTELVTRWEVSVSADRSSDVMVVQRKSKQWKTATAGERDD